MTGYTDAYRDLLIKQYWDKPRARAEIELLASTWEPIRDILHQFGIEFDLDQATGDRLDIIGKIVGMPRVVPLVIPKIAFGFEGYANARGFDDRFALVINTAPFRDRFEPAKSDLELDDYGYRFFIRAKIARNTSTGFMVPVDGPSIQNTIQTLFDGQAYALDNKDMTLTLYVSPTYEQTWLLAAVQLDLLPRPQGVRYYVIIQAAPFESFGFADNAGALGFADKFDTAQTGGYFAEKVLI